MTTCKSCATGKIKETNWKHSIPGKCQPNPALRAHCLLGADNPVDESGFFRVKNYLYPTRTSFSCISSTFYTISMSTLSMCSSFDSSTMWKTIDTKIPVMNIRFMAFFGEDLFRYWCNILFTFQNVHCNKHCKVHECCTSSPNISSKHGAEAQMEDAVRQAKNTHCFTERYFYRTQLLRSALVRLLTVQPLKKLWYVKLWDCLIENILACHNYNTTR